MVQLSTPTNVASIVVHQAMAKSLDKFNAAFNTVPAREQQQLASPGSRQGRKQDKQQQGEAYQVPDAPPELTYNELLVRSITIASMPLLQGFSSSACLVPVFYRCGSHADRTMKWLLSLLQARTVVYQWCIMICCPGEAECRWLPPSAICSICP
jgi:hypothetical protein